MSNKKGAEIMVRYEFERMETKNLILRRFKESDIKRFYTYRNHSEIRRYIGEGWCDCTLAKAKEFIKEQGTSQPRIPKQWFQIAIEEKSRKELIGDLGLYYRESDENQVQIFITIASDYQHEGFAEEAIEATLNYVFQNLDMERVIAIIDMRNYAAVKLLERLEFQRHGDFTTNEEVDGEDITEHLYTLSKKQWAKKDIS